MMDLITMIKTNPNDWIEQLKEEGVIYYLDNYDKPKYLFTTYDYNCKFSKEFTRQCRGSLIDLEKLEYVCRPFDKFFNYGESKAKTIDFASAKILEKLDGSLVKIYWLEDKNRWQIATNGTYDAKIGDNEKFYDLIVKTLYKTYNLNADYFNEHFDKDYTYMFELCTPENIVVVVHKDYKMYFLSKRNKYSGVEVLNADECSMFHKPKEYNFNNLDEVLIMANELPYNDEGFVLIDKYGNRVKIKSSEYVAMHHRVSDKVRLYNLNNLFILRDTQELEEIRAYYPSVAKYLDFLNKYVDEVEKNIRKEIEYGRNLKATWQGTQKEFNQTLISKVKFRNAVFEHLKNDDVFQLKSVNFNFFEKLVKCDSEMYNRMMNELTELRESVAIV